VDHVAGLSSCCRRRSLIVVMALKMGGAGKSCRAIPEGWLARRAGGDVELHGWDNFDDRRKSSDRRGLTKAMIAAVV